MRAALELFEQLGITYVPSSKAQLRGPMVTCCGNVTERLIREHGIQHATIVLRTITESEGNSGELIADIIFAISDIVLKHPRWVDLGLAWLETFDQINLAAIRRVAKATGAAPLHSAVMVLLCAELERLLGPSKLPKPPKAPKVKCEPKPPAWLIRVPGVERNVALGIELLKLRSALKNNRAYGRQVRQQFDIETKLAVGALRVARLYGARPEIYSRLSWNALVHLASPALPAAAREALERRIIAGELIVATEIRAACGALKAAKRGRQADQQQARRMAA